MLRGVRWKQVRLLGTRLEGKRYGTRCLMEMHRLRFERSNRVGWATWFIILSNLFPTQRMLLWDESPLFLVCMRSLRTLLLARERLRKRRVGIAVPGMMGMMVMVAGVWGMVWGIWVRIVVWRIWVRIVEWRMMGPWINECVTSQATGSSDSTDRIRQPEIGSQAHTCLIRI